MQFLLDPFFSFLALTWVAVAWLWYREVNAKRRLVLLTIALAGLTFSCTPIAVRLCGSTLTSRFASAFPPPSDADAIIVLSGGLRQLDDDWNRYQLAEDTLYRCLTAADIYRNHGSVPVFVTGGKVDATRGGPTLAAAMRDFLVRYDIPTTDITTEEISRNTYENAVETAKLLKLQNIQRPILVTDATHLPRAEACFARQGIQVIPVPAVYSTRPFEWSLEEILPNTRAASTMHNIVHEWIGMVWYRIKGRI